MSECKECGQLQLHTIACPHFGRGMEVTFNSPVARGADTSAQPQPTNSIDSELEHWADFIARNPMHIEQLEAIS